MTQLTQPKSVLSPTALTPSQIELKRLISEAREMTSRWGGLVALLERIERNDTLDAIGGEAKALATAHNAAAERWEETWQIVQRLWCLVVDIRPEQSNPNTPPLQHSTTPPRGNQS